MGFFGGDSIIHLDHAVLQAGDNIDLLITWSSFFPKIISRSLIDKIYGNLHLDSTTIYLQFGWSSFS